VAAPSHVGKQASGKVIWIVHDPPKKIKT